MSLFSRSSPALMLDRAGEHYLLVDGVQRIRRKALGDQRLIQGDRRQRQGNDSLFLEPRTNLQTSKEVNKWVGLGSVAFFY
jgi:hypothetical protein